MALSEIKKTNIKNIPRSLRGLAADAKPVVDVPNGSTFFERDTKKIWEYDTGNVNPVTANGWWEV